MSDRNQAILYSGGHKGTEAEFGRCAEKWGVRQVTLSYDGHVMEYSKDVEVLALGARLRGLETSAPPPRSSRPWPIAWLVVFAALALLVLASTR